ncbi:hypothetical protein [Dyella sp. Tek66A03]|uniref:hypothetical protein n=1 Tax=Dyella sp. Tek66A03 TaxID=3458298 RepID=UPI00403EBBD8
MSDDVAAWVRADYKEDAQAVLDALCSFRAGYASVATDRVLRCIVSAADGDAGGVRKYIELAKKDWRDVVTAAEYRYPDVRVRDLSKPFDM